MHGNRNKKMRIVIVNNFYEVTGGADTYCRALTTDLIARGHEVKWLSTCDVNKQTDEGLFIERRVDHENRSMLSMGNQLKVLAELVWNGRAWRAMNQLLDDFQPDVIHVHKAYVQLSVAPIVAASRRHLPIVQTLHDYEFIAANPTDSGGSWIDRSESTFRFRLANTCSFIARKAVHQRLVSQWIAVSNFVEGKYIDASGISSTVLPNFAREPGKVESSISQREGAVYIGRLSREKGIDILLETISETPEIRWRIFGNGSLAPEVQAAANHLQNLDYGGHITPEQCNQELRAAEVAVVPSIWDEPGALSALDAMANGTPLVCFNRGGVAEYVRNADSGLICDEETPAALKKTVRAILSDKELKSKMSENGRRACRTHHSREGHVDSLVEIYRKITERK